tara:strand:- start:17 stop:679 length:663 start_codon:yes stop_codon:yes gene_type:complete
MRLEHLHVQIAREVEEAHRALYAEHAAKSCLQSGATVTASLKLVEDFANKYLDQAIGMVGKVAKDEEAFGLIVSHLTATFRTFEAHKAKSASHACGGPNRPPMPSVIEAADGKFAEIRDLVFQRLQIEKFEFIGSAPAATVPQGSQNTKNPGGKPLAEHWDAMWADIAVQLWLGDLKPSKQADIKAAMLDWFNANEIEIGDTAVTERARKLWQAMEATEG